MSRRKTLKRAEKRRQEVILYNLHPPYKYAQTTTLACSFLLHPVKKKMKRIASFLVALTASCLPCTTAQNTTQNTTQAVNNFTLPANYDRVYQIKDSGSAYNTSATWATIDTIAIRTWNTKEATWDTMYNQSDFEGNATKTIKIDMCLETNDYKTGLTAPCGTISVRGSSSRMHVESRGFLLKIDKKFQMGKWRGTRKIILSRSPFDLSVMRSVVGYELLRIVPDMISLNVNYAIPVINGVPWALYTVIENPSDDFLELHGLDKNGYLLRAKDYYFQSPDQNWPEYKDWLDPLTNDNDAQWYDKVMPLTKAIEEARWSENAKLFETTIRTHFIEENLVTYMAVQVLFNNFDIVNQNYLLYSPSDARRWSLIPWDLDGGLGFCNQESESTEPQCIENLGPMLVRLRTDDTRDNLLYRNLLQVDGFFDRIAQRARQLVAANGPLSPQRCAYIVDNTVNRIRPHIGLATYKDQGPSVDQWTKAVKGLRDFLTMMGQRFEDIEVKGWAKEWREVKPKYPKWTCPQGVNETWCAKA